MTPDGTGADGDLEPPPIAGAAPLDVRRRQQVRRVVRIGVALAAAGAVLLVAIGTDAASVLAATFVALALVLGVAGLVGLVTALVDEWRGHHVPRRRLLAALGRFAIALGLLVAAGAAGAAA